MTKIGRHYGATIDKFVGDAIMIFFGAPTATSDHDHALRAVRMALDMQQRMPELQAEWRKHVLPPTHVLSPAPPSAPHHPPHPARPPSSD